MLTPDKITKAQFNEVLSRYSALIESRATSKTSAELDESKLSLEELDEFRFGDAPGRYYNRTQLGDRNTPPTPLSRDDFLRLVTWKLKHGTFRPNLMNLAKSNTDEEVQAVSKAAYEFYKEDGYKVTNAIKKLTELKGVGPATASLLLSIYDPARVVFFGDEVFIWICQGGKKGTIRYSVKEYEELVSRTRKLIDRLGVYATDVEMVGYVLIKEAGPQPKPPRQVTVRKRPKAPRVLESPVPKIPTEMSAERKEFLVNLAQKGRAGRVTKRLEKKARAEAFRTRVRAARGARKTATAANEKNYEFTRIAEPSQ